MNWEYVTLDKLGSVSRGRSKHRPRNDKALFGGKYPFVQTADVKAAELYLTDYTETYNERGLEQSKLWKAGTLCITIAANIADTAILGIDACFPDSVMGFIPFEGVSNVKFVKYAFDILQRDCQKISQGTAQDNLSWKKLSTINFPAPPIEIQNKIVDILSVYDDLIENNKKQIKLLEETAQRLYKEWFVDLRFPGYEDVDIVDGVPDGWRKANLSEISPIVTGKKDANFGTTDGKYLFFTCAQEPIKAPSFSFDCDAVILAGNGDFNVKLYRGQFEAYQRTYVFSPYNSEYLYLLYYAVKENMRQLFQGASGSTIKFLTKRMLEEILVFVPDEKMLELFNQNCELLQKKIEALKAQISLAQEARERLLPKLMSGEIEV
ncbi:restriction endonuclease subunit S [Bariatricus sp. HCP3S3_E12]|uniref:restriction endonuclease subunit S n=1 Tax=Bariatricus sp. HCP3S3_E12 TaxID=3438906 RepID=UPI003F8A2361